MQTVVGMPSLAQIKVSWQVVGVSAVSRPAVPPCRQPALPGVLQQLSTSGSGPQGDGKGRGAPPWLNMVRGYATHP